MIKVFEKDLITIIIPVYNVEKYLNRCIDTVINQTYRNLEIILVDDGSKDNSGYLCDQLAKNDERIKVIHKSNGGLSDARNIGIKNSNGKYIMFLDSDDWISLDAVYKLYNELRKNHADFVSCKLIETTDVQEKLNFKRFSNGVKKYTQEEYARKFFRIDSNETIHYACGKLFKKEILENDQFPLNLTAEDVVGTYKAILKSNIIVEIDYPYYFYFKNVNSITRIGFSIKDFDLLEIWQIVEEITPKNNENYLKWAYLNKCRVDFTLLMRMAKSLNYKMIKKNYTEEQKIMIGRLKNNKKLLLKSNISFFRKCAILMIIFDYKVFVFICSLIRRLK